MAKSVKVDYRELEKFRQNLEKNLGESEIEKNDSSNGRWNLNWKKKPGPLRELMNS